jgi:hypothetical protein
MLKRKLLTAALIMAATTAVSAAPYGFFDARSVAMGNVSVATGNLTTAALSNPAMLSKNESDDSFALLLPAVGLQVLDNGGMVDLLDDFQLLDSEFSTATPARQFAIVNEMNTLIPQFNGKNIAALLSANVVLAYAADDYSMAIYYRVSGQASANIDAIAGDPDTPALPTGTLNAYGYAVQEIGVSFATSFSIAGMDLSIGVTPKTVQVDVIRYLASVGTVDTGNILSDATEADLGSFSTFDAGLALQLNDAFTLGLVAKNILDETLVSGTETFVFDTQLRAGVAYHNDFLTLAADMDLTENKGSRTTDPLLITEAASKLASIGVEIDLGDIVQLRVGYQTNMASGATDPDLISAGIGLWLGFHLDIAVVAGDDSSLGAFVQTGVRF